MITFTNIINYCKIELDSFISSGHLQIIHLLDPEKQVPYNFVRLLCASNFEIWQYENLIYSAFTDLDRLKFYDDCIKINPIRKQAISDLDTYICQFQNTNGDVYSETIGLILDRWIVLYLKYKYYSELEIEILNQLNFLEKCGNTLLENILKGKIQQMVYNLKKYRTKI